MRILHLEICSIIQVCINRMAIRVLMSLDTAVRICSNIDDSCSCKSDKSAFAATRAILATVIGT